THVSADPGRREPLHGRRAPADTRDASQGSQRRESPHVTSAERGSMFIFLLQVRHMLGGHPEIYMFAVYSALIWLVWAVKVVLSRRYRPFTGTFTGTTSVVVPVVDEPVDLFRDVLRRMVDQQPGEIIVVINGDRNPALE